MKAIKWKQIVITSIICLCPIVFGLLLWDKLPESMAIHFNINYKPDSFASKAFVVFLIPLFMALLQTFCCIVNDIAVKNYGNNTKIELVSKWILPVVSVVLMITTLTFNMGYNIDIHMVVSLLIGCIFVATGLTLPNANYVKISRKEIEPEKAKKINRFFGIESIIMGLLFIISAFLPEKVSIFCLILLIPYSIIGIIYTIKNSR